jgi:hypothetical protein
MSAIEKVTVLCLKNGEMILGCNYAEQGDYVFLEFPALIVANYEEERTSVYLSWLFGKPDKVTFQKDSIVYIYEIDDVATVRAYNKRVTSSVVRVMDNKLIIPQ